MNISIPVLPSGLQIQNVTSNNTVKGIENYPLDLVCKVGSGKPPEELSWKKDQTIIAKGGPRKLVYSFFPNKTDDQSVYSCEVKNEDMKIPLTTRIHLDIECKHATPILRLIMFLLMTFYIFM